MNCLCIGLLCLAPQSSANLDPKQRSIPADDLVMKVFTPDFMDPFELAEIVDALAGSTFNAVDGGSVSNHVQSLRAFDQSVLVYETQERVVKLTELLEQLDQVAAGVFEEGQAEQNARKAEEKAAIVSHAYRPSFLSMDDMQKALLYYRNRFPHGFDFVHDTGLLVMTVPEDVRDEVLDLLSQIDVAPPQISVSAYLIRGSENSGDHPAPADLAQGLGELLGYEHVNIEAQSMLRASGDASELSLRLDLDEDWYYELGMRPTAYATDQGSWSLQECHLDRISNEEESQVVPAVPFKERVFSTQTVIYSGEYTVLGATGSEPELLVLRIRQVAKAD